MNLPTEEFGAFDQLLLVGEVPIYFLQIPIQFHYTWLFKQCRFPCPLSETSTMRKKESDEESCGVKWIETMAKEL
jgi:hypothetical protein